MISVRNASIDLVRRNNQHGDVPLEQIADTVEEVNDNERSLAYQQVRHIIDNELSRNQQMIIDLREIQGLEFDAIAETMNMTAANVRVELSRARKRVREIYRQRKEQKS